MVESGHLNRHVVKIVPMAPNRINLEELNNRMFDTSTGFAEPADPEIPDDTSNGDGTMTASGLERRTSESSQASNGTRALL